MKIIGDEPIVGRSIFVSAPDGLRLHELFSAQFPKLSAADWLNAPQRTWKMEFGNLIQTYDPALAETLADFDIEHTLPPPCNEFDALAGVPVLVIRGATCDILSAALSTRSIPVRDDVRALPYRTKDTFRCWRRRFRQELRREGGRGRLHAERCCLNIITRQR